MYYDKGMAGTRATGGPCGLVHVPDEATVKVSLGPYAVRTVLTSRPGKRQVTVGLWDFNTERDVEPNRAYLRRDGEVIARDVAAVARADWRAGPVPRAQLSQARADELRRQLERQLQPTPYDTMTDEIRTPHIRWAKPLPGGPVRALVVGTRWSQRETVELAQRLDLRYDTVCFSSPDSVLESRWLYLYGSYDLYGCPRKSASSVLADLMLKLRAERDCLVLSGFRPRILPPGIRKAVAEKVRAGTGLVLLGPAKAMLAEFGDGLRPVAWEPDAVPVAALPVFAGMVADKRPVWNTYTAGKGRVLVLNYHTGGKYGRHNLTPYLKSDDPDALGLYDYYHSLVAKAVLWASRREMPVRVRFPAAPGQVVLDAQAPVAGAVLEVIAADAERAFRRSHRVEADLPKGESTHALGDLGLASGPLYVSVLVTKDGKALGWGTAHVDLGAAAPRIQAVKLRRAVLRPGETLGGTVELSQAPEGAAVEVDVRDALGRLLRRQRVNATKPTVPFEFTMGRPLAILHEVRARLVVGERLLDQRIEPFTMPDQRVDDYHLLAWMDGANDAIGHAAMDVLAAHGVDWLDNVGLTGSDAARMATSCRNAARHGLRSIPYATRIHCDVPRGRVRQPCLTNPNHLEPWLAALRERARGGAPYGPPGYTLGDENYLVRPKHDVCTSPTCLAAFRRYLQEQYGTLERLNASWQTKLAGFADAMPATLPEVKDTPGRWPRWADHRQFMDGVFTRAHAMAREAIREVDPQARVGWDGVFSLNSWNGYDFYQLCRACDVLEVYALRHHQIEYMRSWHRPGSILGAWHNRIGNADEISAKRIGWHLLLHGCNSSWYWMAYATGPALLFPDLRPTPQLEWLAESHAEIMGGLGKLLLHATREHDGIAIHYSQASVHAGTLMGRRLATAQWGFARLVEDLGLQYDMLSYEQIAQGKLAGYKVLLMPACAALSDAEAKAIRSFVEQGGLVVADTAPGVLDAHCRLLPKGSLDELLGIARAGLPKAGDAPIQLDAEGPKAELPLSVHDTQLKAAGAKAWASAGNTPCVLVRHAGKGRAVVLNTAIEAYEDLHRRGAGRPVHDLMRRLLALAGVEPQTRITADGADVDACETVRFAHGALEYVCIVKDDDIIDAKAQDVTVHLPREAHVYDVRARQPLGRRRTVETRLVPGDPRIYALLPYAVAGVTVTPAAAEVAPGTTASFQVALATGGGNLAGRHCLRVEIRGPDGTPRRHYAQNVLTETNTTTVRVGLALNDAPGTWQIRATDIATGRSGAAPFTVRAGH